MKTPALLFAVIALVTAPKSEPSLPQTSNSYIEISGQRLTLGMTKAQVTDKLAGSTIRKANENFWNIGAIEVPSEVLQFTNGKLNYASRNWPSTTNDIFESLFGAVSTLNEQGFRHCEVSTSGGNEPNMSSKYVWVHCGEKEIMMMRLTMDSKSYNTVDERLGRYRKTE